MPEIDESTRQYLESIGQGELGTRMGLEFTKLSAEHSSARMPAEGNRQPLGLVHGGAYCVLGESLGSIAAAMHAATLDKYAVGVDINATHTRSIREGWVYAECNALHLGRSMCVHEIVCTDENGKRLSTIRITNFLKDR